MFTSVFAEFMSIFMVINVNQSNVLPSLSPLCLFRAFKTKVVTDVVDFRPGDKIVREIFPCPKRDGIFLYSFLLSIIEQNVW